MNAPDAIRIVNLEKRYGAIVAVQGLSLSVPKGSMFGFLGPNGAGKSTTIGCLTGLLDPTAGSIELLGEPFTAESAALKRRIGVMPETLGLFDLRPRIPRLRRPHVRPQRSRNPPPRY